MCGEKLYVQVQRERERDLAQRGTRAEGDEKVAWQGSGLFWGVEESWPGDNEPLGGHR